MEDKVVPALRRFRAFWYVFRELWRSEMEARHDIEHFFIDHGDFKGVDMNVVWSGFRKWWES
jgi:hypothetical protein